MSCFSLAIIENLLIWAVVVVALIMILRLVVPAVISAMGVTIWPWLTQALNIVIGAAVMIFLIIVVFWLISCFTHGTFSLPRAG